MANSNTNSYENEILLCSKCGEIPEILKVHTDNSTIEFNCRNCGEYEISIDNHFAELSKKYSNNNHSDDKVDETKNKCLEHNEEFQYFCFDCKKNLCETEKKNYHEIHETIEIKKMRESLIKNQNKIDEINAALQNIVEFNETILDKAEIFKNQQFYINSIKNMGKSLKEGNERNTKDIKCLFNGLSDGIKNSLTAIESLIDNKDIYLHRDDKYLHLNDRKLEDQDFKDISHICFNQLKEIDISENKIKTIQSLKKMSLPFLEFLNLSYNNIKKIEPVTKLKSKKLEYIFLQNNEIEDIDTFSDSNFEKIKILRAENYNTNLNLNIENEANDENNEEIRKIKNIQKKYPNKFIYTPIKKQIEDFEKEYNIEISEDKENVKKEIDLCDIKGGQKMLKALFLIITYKPKNNIKKLILRNNDIEDPSMLNKINFNKLEILDLAVNEIKDLIFLIDMKAKNLKYLYLDNNNFKEIHQILKANLPSLEVLSLNENLFESEKMDQAPEYIELKKTTVKNEKSDSFGKPLTVQLEKGSQNTDQTDTDDKKSKETKPNEANSNS